MLVSGAEPRQFLVLSGDGTYSSEPEKYGADFMFFPRGQRCAVQRKETTDLVASLRDDRIARELAQMRALDQAILLVEGDWKWNKAGESQRRDAKYKAGFTKAHYDGVAMSFQAQGVWVVTSTDIDDSIGMLRRIERFLSRDDHRSLSVRPKVQSDLWGTARSRDWSIHLLQSFEGISVVTAGAIYDQLGCPLQWTCTEADLLAISGVGKKRAANLIGAFNGRR